MKNKFNIGDKVICIIRNEEDTYWAVFNATIDTGIFSKDGLSYWLTKGEREIEEKNLYTKEEAIEFLKGVL